MSSFFRFLKDVLLTLLYPPFCCGCSKLGALLCHYCYQQVQFLPLPITLKLEKQYLDQLISVANYQHPITDLIKEMKYRSVIGIAKTCAELIYYSANLPRAEIITAVPLHSKRLKERGFNQAQQISLELSKLTGIPCVPLLKRTINTDRQASISNRATRLTQLSNCFKVTSQVQSFKTVLLIDDVATTGTTLNECAKVLKKHGVKRVIGLTVAHGT